MICAHIFKDKEKMGIRINNDPDKVDENFLVGVDFRGDALKLSPEVIADIARYLKKHLETGNNSKIIMPKAGDIILLNRQLRRKIKK